MAGISEKRDNPFSRLVKKQVIRKRDRKPAYKESITKPAEQNCFFSWLVKNGKIYLAILCFYWLNWLLPPASQVQCVCQPTRLLSSKHNPLINRFSIQG